MGVLVGFGVGGGLGTGSEGATGANVFVVSVTGGAVGKGVSTGADVGSSCPGACVSSSPQSNREVAVYQAFRKNETTPISCALLLDESLSFASSLKLFSSTASLRIKDHIEMIWRTESVFIFLF